MIKSMLLRMVKGLAAGSMGVFVGSIPIIANYIPLPAEAVVPFLTALFLALEKGLKLWIKKGEK